MKIASVDVQVIGLTEINKKRYAGELTSRGSIRAGQRVEVSTQYQRNFITVGIDTIVYRRTYVLPVLLIYFVLLLAL